MKSQVKDGKYMSSVKVGPKGQIVILKEVRDLFQIQPGDTLMLLADKEQRGLANSTYYIGLDLGMTLGPAIGGMLCGHVPIALFYPVLLITLPLAALVYFICRRYSGI